MKNKSKKLIIGILWLAALFTAKNAFAVSVAGQPVFNYLFPQTICSINSFNANQSSVTSGDSFELSWNTSNCTSVNIYPTLGLVDSSGSQDVWPITTTTYTLMATDLNGAVQDETLTVFVEDTSSDCSINDFSASDRNIENGGYTILRWDTEGCSRIKISDIGYVLGAGTKRVYPTEDTTYVLSAYDSSGSRQTESVKIYVNDNNNSDTSCSIDKFTASDTYINQGDRVTLRWNTSDCDYAYISNIGDVDLDGTETIYPSYTTTYTLRASGNNSESRSIRIYVDNNNTTNIPATNVTTNPATNVSQTSAQLNGLVTGAYYTNVNVYFEYGTTANLGTRTIVIPTNGNVNFYSNLSGLNPGTIYYFQAISEGPNGVLRGGIEVFQTLKNIPVINNNNIYIQPAKKTTSTNASSATTTNNLQSQVMLKIENRYQTIEVGDIIDYVVSYKNISKSKLTKPMIQVAIPKGMTVLNISEGTYSKDDRTFSDPINDLNPDVEGNIYLQARVDSLDSNLSEIVTTAILIYTDVNGAQENAVAYVINNPKISNSLGAAAFFGRLSGIGLIGWLVIIIFILLLILIARSLSGRRNRSVAPVHNQ